ncbi:MAG TPA: adenylosuccinate lyase [Thermoanaerobaculia bacterium]|nr:adenylosuccinate lyase [Thermoanaerobaculia bacterium]
MAAEAPQNPLHERYASPEMARIFSASHRYGAWRELWIALAEAEAELGLPIHPEQLAALRAAAPRLDLARVAELERRTRHDVVAHLRHFAEQADAVEAGAGGILHLGATSAFLTDNTDVLLAREALELLAARLAAAIRELAAFARRTRAVPSLAYTHFQPAQLTTVGKRACLWLQDLASDHAEVRHRLATLRCRGAKGTTGTQASFLTLFAGDHGKVRELDRRLAARLGFAAGFPVTGQTYPRKQDSQVLAALAGIAESCHKLGTDLRLLQGVGELAEPFDAEQVGSSAMAYKRNPVRAERMCGLARRLITDSLNGPLNAATQWLERSLDDSANRRLVLEDSFLTADAVLLLAAHIAAGLTVREATVAARVARELPFMATETFLMEGTLRGGDRQALHERLRGYSLEAQEAVERGGENPLVERIAGDPDFRITLEEARGWLDPAAFTGRSAEQVDEFLAEVVEPLLAGAEAAAVAAPRI